MVCVWCVCVVCVCGVCVCVVLVCVVLVCVVLVFVACVRVCVRACVCLTAVLRSIGLLCQRLSCIGVIPNLRLDKKGQLPIYVIFQ